MERPEPTPDERDPQGDDAEEIVNADELDPAGPTEFGDAVDA
jgi:hypothetical protein